MFTLMDVHQVVFKVSTVTIWGNAQSYPPSAALGIEARPPALFEAFKPETGRVEEEEEEVNKESASPFQTSTETGIRNCLISNETFVRFEGII
jgi:hypothetical protein